MGGVWYYTKMMTKGSSPIRAIVFDFDGLILDTEGPEFQAWCEIYAAHGCQLDLEAWAVGIGTLSAFDPYAHLEATVGRAIDSHHPARPSLAHCEMLL